MKSRGSGKEQVPGKRKESLELKNNNNALWQERKTPMKVLVINGSAHPNGNTAIALKEVERTLQENGIETEWIHIGNKDIRGCIGCGYCRTHGECVFNDLVNETATKFEEVDGIVVGSPVYFAQANATLTAFLTRLFYSTPFDKTMKVGASVVACRRGGASATFDQLNKFFTISQMPVVSSQYWNSIHGRSAGEAREDGEGLQIMRTLGRNMAFLIKAIAAQKEKDGLPVKEDEHIFTNFIR